MGAIKLPLGADLVQGELQNARIQNLASDPGSPVEGQIWYNTTTHKYMYRDNGGNRDITYLAQILALRLDQFVAPNTSLSMGSQKIINVLDGSSAQDAATYGQLLALVNGLDWKNSCRVATTANITLSATQTIDGVSVVAGDRVLVKNQTTGSANGIYVVAAGAWARSTDADASAEITANMAVFISEGTTQADTQWQLTTNDTIVLGTTSLTFAQIGAGTTYSQGTGISISGSTISLDTAVAVRKYATSIGDGAATSFTVTHNLGTLDVQVVVRLVSTGEQVLVDNVAATTNTVTIGTFATAPTTNQYRVIVQA